MTFTKPKAEIACRHRTCCFEFGEGPQSSIEFVCCAFFLLKDARAMAPGSVIASPLLSWKTTHWRPLLWLCSPQLLCALWVFCNSFSSCITFIFSDLHPDFIFQLRNNILNSVEGSNIFNMLSHTIKKTFYLPICSKLFCTSEAYVSFHPVVLIHSC